MTNETLHECHDCGRFQAIVGLRPGQVAVCERCSAVLRRRRRDSLSTVLALSVAGVALLVVAAGTPLMSIRLAGQERAAALPDLPLAFEVQDMPVLAVAVLATTLLAPALRLLLTIGVLGGLQAGLGRRALVTMARLRAMLTPWAMIEVFLLGLFVAYTRLEVLATVQSGIGLYALGALMLVTAWADTWLDEEAMWEAIGRQPSLSPGQQPSVSPGQQPSVSPGLQGPVLAPGPARSGRLIGCDACGMVSRGHEGEPCLRCETPLRHRKPEPIGRTWALLITGAVLYIPANIYPVLTVIRLGKGAPSTILGGVEELIEYRMWPLAILVFVASILVPVAKLVGLGTLVWMAQRGSPARLPERTKIFRLVDAIGRWSMIDVFMVAILTALVRMGLVGSVTPGYGAVAFACVVVVTMLAALSFDPRVMWDRAEERARREAGAVRA